MRLSPPEMDYAAAPVKGIIKALDTGIKLAKRVSKSAASAPGEQSLQISEAAHILQRALEESSEAISDIYRSAVGRCGQAFTKALIEDQPLQPRLKDLRIDLIDSINECDFDEDEPHSFNPATFSNAQQQAQKCRVECISIFNDLQDRLPPATPQDRRPEEQPKDDRAQLSSMRAANGESVPRQPPTTPTSAQHDKPVLSLDTPQVEPLKLRSPWSVDGAIQDGEELPAAASGAAWDSAPVLQGPYRGDMILGISPKSDYKTEETNHRRPHEQPYQRSPTGQSPGKPVSDVPPLTDQPPPLIAKDVVHSRLNQNEEFLEKRRQSRISFRNEMGRSISSISSVEENRASQTYIEGSIFSSPVLGHSTMLGSPRERPTMPLTRSSGGKERRVSANSRSGPWDERLASLSDRPTSYNDRNRISESYSESISPAGLSPSVRDGRTSRAGASGYDTLTTRQRSQEPISQASRSSRTNSLLQDARLQERTTLERKDSHTSQASQESIFGLRNAAPLSPPLSEHRTSGNEKWGAPAATLQVPGFREDVADGIEVIDNIDRDNGLILASEDQVVEPTPAASMGSVHCPMRQDTSFYKFGGFCEGAKALIRGETGFKIMKRPAGHYSATVSARCIKCSYEVGWNDVEKDRLLDRAGIYINHGIRFRQKFISKSHLRTNNIDEPIYACIFCVEENRTVEEHDATVFFAVSKLFEHLAKHFQPLPNIGGLNVLYGHQPPHVLDFDINFVSSETKFPEFRMMEIAAKVATRAAATAVVTHHPKSNRSNFWDPEGKPALHFAVGARIVGVTFPERFNGQWCIGYHDGERGSFPASAIHLEMPVHEDVGKNSQSNLIAFAKWDWKPKDAKDGGWLKFSKGDKISCVGFTFQDQWCWSGQIGTGAKAKFGLFPAVFVEGLTEETGSGSGKMGTSPGSVKTSGRGLSSLGSIIGIHKAQKGHERSMSVKSSGSRGSVGVPGMVMVQPGLEVVQSPIHSPQARSWRG